MKRNYHQRIKLKNGITIYIAPFEPKPDSLNIRIPKRIRETFKDVNSSLDLVESELWRLALTLGLNQLKEEKNCQNLQT